MLRIVILFILAICVLAAQEDQTKKFQPIIECYQDNDDPLIYVRCTFPQLEEPGSRWRHTYRNVFTLPSLKVNNQIRSPLYAFDFTLNPGQSPVHYFRLQLDLSSVDAVHFHDTRHYNNHKDKKGVPLVKLSGQAGSQLKSDWRAGYKKKLLDAIDKHEDHELELLMYWRFFGDIPRQGYSHWKNDRILKFIYTFSGLNDIEDAIPNEKSERLGPEVYDVEPPKPILLPQVPTNKAVDPLPHSLGQFVPRSCYYIEWESPRHMVSSIGFAVNTFDQWSQGAYPLSAKAAIDAQFARFDLSQQWLLGNKNIRRLAVAGWDPFIQSGTNLMLIIESENPLDFADADLQKPVFFSRNVELNGKHITILATCQRLIKMSEQSERSLASVDQFRMSRKRLSEQENEEEFGFVYLSDYWLTNFVSPRWMLLNARRRQIDARIRLAFLLKEMLQAERDEPVTLSEVKDSGVMPVKELSWILDGLVERKGKIVHEVFGGIGAHTPIDEVPFNMVSKREFQAYESFRNMYMRRWRQMDPIAFQVVRCPESLWKSRLYVSPISNNSDFRFIRQILLPEKQTHQIQSVANTAYGISIKFSTNMAMGMGVPMKLPAIMVAQAVGYDAAPSSYRPSSWLEDMPEQDWISYMRMPVVVMIPQVLYNQFRVLGMREEETDTRFAGLQRIDDVNEIYSPYAWVPANQGYTALSMNPMTLMQVKEANIKTIETRVPSDLYVWFDFDKGYNMTRKLWQLAVMNRTLASWRRQNRLYRIENALGSSDVISNAMSAMKESKDNKVALPKDLSKRVSVGHYFPTVRLKASAEDSLPRTLTAGERDPYLYRSGSASKYMEELPTILYQLKSLDAYISVEDNALYYENHIKLYSLAEREDEAAPVGGNPANGDPSETQLDFDD